MSEQGNDIYNLKIDAYTPETIPMARLAEYLSALAELLGEKHCVHFQGVAPGSTQLACVVEHEAAYRVTRRVENVASANADTPLGRAYRGIRRLLREDSAGAQLSCNARNVLIFPGVQQQASSVVGPFWQSISHAGVLVRIGGRDATAHAVLQNREGTHWSFAVNRALAKRLAGYLYGPPIRMIGRGKRRRDEDGVWQEESLEATHFEVLMDAGWPETLQTLHKAVGAWPEDTMETLMALRDGGD